MIPVDSVTLIMDRSFKFTTFCNCSKKTPSILEFFRLWKQNPLRLSVNVITLSFSFEIWPGNIIKNQIAGSKFWELEIQVITTYSIQELFFHKNIWDNTEQVLTIICKIFCNKKGILPEITKYLQKNDVTQKFTFFEKNYDIFTKTARRL